MAAGEVISDSDRQLKASRYSSSAVCLIKSAKRKTHLRFQSQMSSLAQRDEEDAGSTLLLAR